MWKKCGPCPVFASFTLAFGLQLRKKHGKTSARVENPQSGWKNLSHDCIPVEYCNLCIFIVMSYVFLLYVYVL
jgi:hypothetical protein